MFFLFIYSADSMFHPSTENIPQVLGPMLYPQVGSDQHLIQFVPEPTQQLKASITSDATPQQLQATINVVPSLLVNKKNTDINTVPATGQREAAIKTQPKSEDRDAAVPKVSFVNVGAPNDESI